MLYGGGKTNWSKFRHNGPMFPEEYKQHNLPILLNNKILDLTVELEEKFTSYAKYIGTDYLENSKFNKNFYKEIKKDLPNLSFDEFLILDFSKIIDFHNKLKEDRLSKTKDEKDELKEIQLELEKPYSILQIDGQQQKIGNFKIEPPGIFLGRGSHPKIGQWKNRIFPKDIILNLDKDAPIPKPHLYHDKTWEKVVNQPESIWLVTWKDYITGKNKYVFPSVESTFKSESDKEKFDLARKLKNKVTTIRTQYFRDLESTDIVYKQLATALYFIDELALRVGGKKDSKEQADTVGVTSLRVEHLSFPDKDLTIKLDFLGKDSVRFCKLVQVPEIVYNNLKLLTIDKNKKLDLFDKITNFSLNSYLKSFMPELTAKVWRTFKASTTFQKELNKIKEDDLKNFNENEKINYLLSKFNYANTQVALLCNHQKNISKNFDDQIDKFKDKIKDLRKKKTKTKNKEKERTIANKILLEKSKLETKSKMKNVSLGTSKTNYIDPRIIMAFANKFNIPHDKLFTKSLLSRFEWALVDKTFVF